jgi:ubiquinone/menaquinone biosynthesis C-methylase UbiE
MQPDEYLKLAEVEDRMWYFRSLHAHVFREVSRFLPAEQPARVLDAGCGTGGLMLRLHAMAPAWRVNGLDYSAIACELARQRTGGEVVQASITALPFAEATFDAVLLADVLSQVDEPARALAEAFRCLRPGGPLFVNVPAYPWMWSYHDDSCQVRHRYVRQELKARLTAAGFEPVFATYVNMLPFPLLALKRKVFRSAGDTSDVRLFPAPIEAAFNGLMALEHACLRARVPLPYGSSVLVVGRKPGDLERRL